MSTPNDNRIINGRLRPSGRRHLSLSEPRIGVRKKPIIGDRAQTSVMCLCSTPIFNKVGETNAEQKKMYLKKK